MAAVTKSARQRLEEAGYEGIKIFSAYSYDDALVGVTPDDRAVYDFDKMVEWLMQAEGWSREDAIERIEYNTLRSFHPLDTTAPIVMYPLEMEVIP